MKFVILTYEDHLSFAEETKDILKQQWNIDADIVVGYKIGDTDKITGYNVVCLGMKDKIVDVYDEDIYYLEDDVRFTKNPLDIDLSKDIVWSVYRKGKLTNKPPHNVITGLQAVYFSKKALSCLRKFLCVRRHIQSDSYISDFINKHPHLSFEQIVPTMGYEKDHISLIDMARNDKKQQQRNKTLIIVHQIYGIFDDKPMNELFKKSHKLWIEYCLKYNIHYKLWDKKSCETLIEEYPEYKEHYNNMRYEIMKVDLIRYIILSKYGGIYSDLDVFPDLDYKYVIKDDFYFSKNENDKQSPAEIELIYCPINKKDVFKKICDYTIQQINEKSKIEIYNKWKARYVLQTTGPRMINRFLRINKIPFHYYPDESYKSQDSFSWVYQIDKKPTDYINNSSFLNKTSLNPLI